MPEAVLSNPEIVSLRSQKYYIRLMKKSFVYILTNKSNRVLYTGVTSDIQKRIYQHKTKFYKDSFSARYNCNKLVYFSEFTDIKNAIQFEKKLKAGNRLNKEKLIVALNPEWNDLAEDWPFNF